MTIPLDPKSGWRKAAPFICWLTAARTLCQVEWKLAEVSEKPPHLHCTH